MWHLQDLPIGYYYFMHYFILGILHKIMHMFLLLFHNYHFSIKCFLYNGSLFFKKHDSNRKYCSASRATTSNAHVFWMMLQDKIIPLQSSTNSDASNIFSHLTLPMCILFDIIRSATVLAVLFCMEDHKQYCVEMRNTFNIDIQR